MKKIFSRIVERRQDFRCTPDYPHGFIVETLSCGHEHHEEIQYYDAKPTRKFVRDQAIGEIENPREKHWHSAKQRRCVECERTHK